ncbi:MAG: DEAD/DEAH box helicase family protein, partial [Sphaerochaetaceae bacterium]|nr:DEAD/DEAH box helicase family protein [Sphaerochaetaceae bacterium]
TRELPLRFAKAISQIVKKEWDEGTYLQKVTPLTRDLLKFWDPEGSWKDQREIQFHKGQWQAILNTIYIHEILKTKNLKDLYKFINKDLFAEFLNVVSYEKEKYEHKQYCIKMATGTGKTWVLSALLIWQFLNAKHTEEYDGLFTKNFLLIAPGLIVYERLLDAYLGKKIDEKTRDFNTSDFFRYKELFVPQNYVNEVFSFIQNSVVEKKEIGRKVTGEGIIAITNWHLLVEEEEFFEELGLDDSKKIIQKLLPISPGVSKGHSLNELDQSYLKGKELEFLSELKDLVIFNDEAHHLNEFKKSNDEIIEKKWQKAISKISKNKKDNLTQIDFSATPYAVTGSGQSRSIHYFPHIIVDFDLKEAIIQGLVKTVAIDKRKELAALPLDFKAERDENGKHIQSLSDGQRIMLRAGLAKLKILEEGFEKWDDTKIPKMLVMCEDTKVAPYVAQFFKQEGLNEDEIVEIHSNKNGDVLEEDKLKLSKIDKTKNPRVIISVLMLREGFDVNNICVIVPLRSSTSYILLEQTIGRGLRLMWREKYYEELKEENRTNLLIKKIEPNNYLDILSIIEHPAFIEFYDRVLGDAIGKVKELPKQEKLLGDLIKINLKENYKDYDLFWPIIINDREESFEDINLSLENLEPYPIKIEELKLLLKEGDTFYGEEITVKTRFGEYQVTSDIFNAKSYQQFIQKVVNVVSSTKVALEGKRKSQDFPLIQINSAKIAELIDNYIRHKLFSSDFDPLLNNNWKILILTEGKLIRHVVKNISQEIYNLQKRLKVLDATVKKIYFSEVKEIKIRENYSLDVAKTIYPKIGYPSNKGGFEKKFIEYIDSDSKVESFIKINENIYLFANILYIRDDGMLAHYCPDFLVKLKDKIYVVETKAEKDLNQEDVLKKRLATCDWCEKINELKEEDRLGRTWKYVLLGEKTFDNLKQNGANIIEMLESPGVLMSKAKLKGTLADYLGLKEY